MFACPTYCAPLGLSEQVRFCSLGLRPRLAYLAALRHRTACVGWRSLRVAWPLVPRVSLVDFQAMQAGRFLVLKTMWKATLASDCGMTQLSDVALESTHREK